MPTIIGNIFQEPRYFALAFAGLRCETIKDERSPTIIQNEADLATHSSTGGSERPYPPSDGWGPVKPVRRLFRFSTSETQHWNTGHPAAALLRAYVCILNHFQRARMLSADGRSELRRRASCGRDPQRIEHLLRLRPRLSTMNYCPKRSDNCCAQRRAMLSLPPPAAIGK